MNFFSEFNDDRMLYFLETLNVESFNLDKIYLDYLILKAKEHGFIETYELTNADISDKYFLALAVILCKFDSDHNLYFLPYQYSNLRNIHSLSLSAKAKEELLNALYDIQDGVVNCGQKRRIIKKWEDEGSLDRWSNYIDSLIKQIQSINVSFIADPKKYTYNNDNTLDLNNDNLDTKKIGTKKNSHKNDSFSIFLHLTIFICVTIITIIAARFDFNAYHMYLNFMSNSSVGVINAVYKEDTKDNGVLYTYDVTYIKSNGFVETGKLIEVQGDYDKRSVGSQIEIVYSNNDPKQVFEKKIYKNPFYFVIIASFIFFIFSFSVLLIKITILNKIKSTIIRTSVYFTVITLLLFVMTASLIYQNRFDFYRYTSVSSPSDFYEKKGRLYRIKDDVLFSGRVKVKDGDIIKIKSYKYGLADGLDIEYVNSMIKSIGVFTRGFKNGLFVKYANNGKIRTYEHYKNDVKHGITRFFNSQNGSMIFEGAYAYGRRDGCFRTYYDNGTLQSQMFFKNGFLNGRTIIFHKNGLPKMSVSFNKNRPNGSLIIYNNNGTISYKDFYEALSFDNNYVNRYQSSEEFFNRYLISLLQLDTK